VRLDYKAKDGETYILNLMDTPGHVDFAYEVSRSLPPAKARCWWSTPPGRRGADAGQRLSGDRRQPRDRAGPQQDRPARRRARRVKQQIEDVIGLDASTRCSISAKTGIGIDDVLEAIVTRLPPPKGDRKAPLKALLVDSWYDAYLGVVVLVRVIDGVLKKGQKIRMMADRRGYQVDKSACSRPSMRCRRTRARRDRLLHRLDQGGGRHPRRRHHHRRKQAPCAEALPGFKPAQPVVFCGLFPVDAADFEDLRDAMGKLRLNDASFSYEMETSAALGFGFRCGFLGLLHLEIIQERLEREFDLDLITTAPSVVYKLT
jgi:GTP-binding protein LepA